MPQNAATPRHLLVLDPRHPAWGTLLASAGDDVTVLVLDVAQDGLTQAAEVAAELAPLESIRLTGPGGAGRVVLGTTTLECEIPEERGPVLRALGATLLPHGLLELSGAAGSGTIGGRLMAALGRATGRDVTTADGFLNHSAGPEPLPLSSPAWIWTPPYGRAMAETATLR